MNSQNNITKKSKRYGDKVWITLCSPLDFWPPLLYSMQTKSTCVCSEWRPCDCAFAQPIGAGQLEHRGNILLQCMHFVKIVKSALKSRFFAISPNFNDFTRFQLDFTHFDFFQTIQHAKHVLTCKIVWFYKSKRDFNNLGSGVC